MSEHDLKTKGILAPSYVPYNPSVYVCQLRSIHVCTPDDCSLYAGTHNGTCPITGIYHGHTEGEKAYVMPEKRTATFRRTGPGKGMKAATNIAMQAESQRTHERGIQHMMIKDAHPHTDGDDDDNVFGVLGSLASRTRPAQQHSEDDEHNGGGGGGGGGIKRELERDIEQEFPDAAAPPPPQTKKIKFSQRTEKTVQHLRDVAEGIIQTLLYSKERQHINAQKRKQLMDAKEQETRNYYHSMSVARRIPVMTEVLVLMAKYDMEPPYLNILRPNKKKVSHYVDVVVETWFAIMRSPWIQQNPGFKFETHAFCVLYMMRKGLTINNVVVIPRIHFMINLPVRVDLPMFGKQYCSKVFTNGQKAIKAAFKSMHASGMPEHTYMLNLATTTTTTTRDNKKGD